MDKQQQAPILEPFFIGKPQPISPIWQRWFQRLKTVDDEQKKKPASIYTASRDIGTWDLGKTISFNCTTEITGILPDTATNLIWTWITIFRTGTERLTITAGSADKIDYGSIAGSIYCEERLRTAASVTLQVIALNQWAIIAGFGLWDID